MLAKSELGPLEPRKASSWPRLALFDFGWEPLLTGRRRRRRAEVRTDRNRPLGRKPPALARSGLGRGLFGDLNQPADLFPFGASLCRQMAPADGGGLGMAKDFPYALSVSNASVQADGGWRLVAA